MSDTPDPAAGQAGALLDLLDRRLGEIERSLATLHREVQRMQKLVGPFGVYMGDGLVLTQMLTGSRFLVPAADHVMAPKMIGNRIWEPRVSAALPRLLRPGRDVVDVGANVGYFSVSAAMILGRGSGAVVHAIEPNPRIHDLLLKNISINWSLARIIPHQVAIGTTEGEMLLHVSGRLPSKGSLLRPVEDGAGTEIFPVRVKPLAQVVPDAGRIGLLKIDVEGAEAMVVRGAADLLRAAPDIELIMEWDIAAQQGDPGATGFLTQFFAETGFSAHVLDDNLAAIPIAELPQRGYCNLFLTRTPERRPG